MAGSPAWASSSASLVVAAITPVFRPRARDVTCTPGDASRSAAAQGLDGGSPSRPRTVASSVDHLVDVRRPVAARALGVVHGGRAAGVVGVGGVHVNA